MFEIAENHVGRDFCLDPEEIVANLMIPALAVKENGSRSKDWTLGIRICRAGVVFCNKYG